VIPEENISDSISVLIAEEPALDQRRRFARDLRNGKRAPVHEDDDNRLCLAARRRSRRADDRQGKIALRSRQLDECATRCLGAHVLALAEHEYDGVGPRRGNARGGESAAIDRVYWRASHADDSRRGAESGTNSRGDGDGFGGLASCSPVAKRGPPVICEWADDGDAAKIFSQRKGLVRVLEENDAL